MNSFNQVLHDRAIAILENTLELNLNYLVNDKRELSFKELDGNAQEIALQEIKYDLWDLYGVELDEQNQNEYLDCFTFKPTYDRAGTCVNIEYIQNKDIEDVISRMNDTQEYEL